MKHNIAFKFGELGYFPVYSKACADDLNASGVDSEVLDSAFAGSMFGWKCKAAARAVAVAQYMQGGRA